MPLNQDTRFISIGPPLGDQLALTGFSGHEEMSRLFTYELELTSESESISPKDVIGKNVTVRIEVAEGTHRYLNGYISRFTTDYGDGDVTTFRAEMVPWLWHLTQTADCRIFQNESVPDIIEKIFKDLGFNDFDKSEIKQTHDKLEYCVQYRETDFNFVSRLMEQEGIFYYFKHEDGKHTLMLADQTAAYKDLPEKEVECPLSEGSSPVADHIVSWEHQYTFVSGRWAQTDYNFETPSKSLMTNSSTKVPLNEVKNYEVYDYPGEYLDKGKGGAETKYRMEEEEVAYDTVRGTSSCRTFNPGGKFKLTKHSCKAEENKTYVITSIEHSAQGVAYATGASTAPTEYANSFTCIPADVIFRPARSTPKPVVSGIQTAVVVGPSGEEIYCDKYGRVKVQFHWDREGKKDEESSCWIRVANNIAGKKWGFMSIPRIGQEVVVDFLEGDPDRPLVVGSVYNGEQMPHYPLPDEMTKSYIKTNSSKGGKGYNELMFEDKKDEERLFLHAQKNMDVRVRNDSKARIYGNSHHIVGWEKDGDKGGDERKMIYQDKHLNIKRHDITHIEGNAQLMVGNGEADDGGNLDIVIEKTKTENIGEGSDLTVTGPCRQKIDGPLSQTIAGDVQIKSGGNIAAESGAINEIHLKGGMKVIIEAGMQLSLVGPGGFVDIGPAGVTIQGIMVKINSGGSAGSGSGCKPEEPEDAKEAAPTEPAMAWNSMSGMKSSPD